MKKVSKIFANVLLWVLLALAAVFIFFTLSKKQETQLASLFGFSPLSVQTDSMTGKNKDSFNAGDLIVISSVDDRKNLKVGDVITFWDLIGGTKQLNTHRIVEIDDSKEYSYFYTQGDGNDERDFNPKTFDEIVGRYQFKVPGMGGALDFLSSSWGILC